MALDKPCINTDRELWREAPDDYYAPSVHVTKAGSIGISVGGVVHVKTLREWHRLAERDLPEQKIHFAVKTDLDEAGKAKVVHLSAYSHDMAWTIGVHGATAHEAMRLLADEFLARYTQDLG